MPFVFRFVNGAPRRVLALLSVLLLAPWTTAAVAATDAGTGGRDHDVNVVLCNPTHDYELWPPVIGDPNPEHQQKYCDSYHASDDLTPNQKTWVEAEYEFDITSTSQFDMAMTWAIREYDASELGIGGLIDPVYELLGPSGTGLISSRDGLIGGDYDDQNDGLPADVLRHFLDTEIPSTNITVGQQLIRSVEGNITSLLSNLGTISDAAVAYTPSIDVDGGTTIQCMTDPDFDSTHEVSSVESNIFDPPICFQITATVEPDGGFFSLGNITGTELERAFRGFLAMGTNISIGAGDGSAFSVFSRPGHISTFEITPPVFASVRSVGPDNLTGVTSRTRAVTDLDNGNHNIGVWTVDHLGATGTDDLAADLQIGLTHRSTAATPGLQIDESSENALNVEVELDMSTGETAQITLKADVHYLSAETLESWGVSFAQLGDDVAEFDYISADGIRLAVNTLDGFDLDSITDSFPLDAIADAIEGSVGQGSDLNITMSDAAWVETANFTDEPGGGLDFRHQAGSTECAETADIPLYYCTRGTQAMGIEHPVRILSQSNVFNLSLLDLFRDQVPEPAEGETSYAYNIVQNLTENDLQAILNSGMSLNMSLGEDLLSDMDFGLGTSEMALVIRLPYWMRSESGSSTIRLVESAVGVDDYTLSLAGTRDFVPSVIENDAGVQLCSAEQPTCVLSDMRFDTYYMNFNEFTQSFEMAFSLDASIAVHRIALPPELLENISSEQFGISLDMLPADLLRHIVDIATSAGIEPIPIDALGLTLELTNEGLMEFADEVGPAVTNLLHSNINNLTSDVPNPIPDATSEQLFTEVDLDAFSFSVDLAGLGSVNANEISDQTPISMALQIPSFSVKIQLEGPLTDPGGWSLGITTAPYQAFMMLHQAILQFMHDLLGHFVGSVISLEGITPPSGTNGIEIPITGGGIGDFSESTNIDGLSLSGPFEISLPKGLKITANSDLGLAFVRETADGRSVLSYTMPSVGEQDTIYVQITVTWWFILKEVWVYLAAVGGMFVFLRLRRRRRKRKRKQIAAQKQAVTMFKTGVSNAEFSNYDPFLIDPDT